MSSNDFPPGYKAEVDGPFTEAKEVVGGLAILQAPSKEAAIEYVKEFMKIAGDGECELRQLREMPPNPPQKQGRNRNARFTCSNELFGSHTS